MTDRALKSIAKESVPRAIEKAERYRLLNDPHQAVSICHDVLAIDPDSAEAKRILILALTDQFASGAHHVKAARELAKSLPSPYEQSYYLGIVYEREARAFLAKGLSGSFAFEAFHEAMSHFEAAEKLRPPGNDDAILRYNSCLRTIDEHELTGRDYEPEHPLE